MGSGERMNYSVMGTYGLDIEMIEGNDCLSSAVQIICMYPTQNSISPNHQDAECGNPLTNAHTANLTTFWTARNFYPAPKTAGHFLVLTLGQINLL